MDAKLAARLKTICANVNKEVPGAGATWLANTDKFDFNRFSSQIPSLDEVLGGGWPLGKIVEIFGAPSTGKTTLCYHAISEFQRSFPSEPIAWIDSEASIDPPYAQKIGVDIEPLIIQTPDTGEQAFNTIRHLLKNGVKMIVVDSVAALVPEAERAKAFGEKTMGEAARLMSIALKQLTMDVFNAGAILMFTNQTRDKIGVMYGEKSTTPGGKALGFYASIRLELRPLGFEKEGEKVVCTKIKATGKKNKTAAPCKFTEYTITFGLGVDGIVDTLNTAIDYGIVEKAGAWFSYNGAKIGCGKAAALEHFKKGGDTLFGELKAAVDAAKLTGKVIKPIAVAAKVKKPKVATKQDAEESDEMPADDFNEPAGNIGEVVDVDADATEVTSV